MSLIIGIALALGAVFWAMFRCQRGPGLDKPILVCLVCVWFPLIALDIAFREVRSPVILLLSLYSCLWQKPQRGQLQPMKLHLAVWVLIGLMFLSATWAINRQDSALRAAGMALVFLFVLNLLRTTDPERLVGWLAEGLLYASYVVVFIILYMRGSLELGEIQERYAIAETMQATGTAALCIWALARLAVEAVVRRGWVRWLHLALTLFTLVSLVRTGTRGPMLQFLALCPLLLTVNSKPGDAAGLTWKYLIGISGAGFLAVVVWTALPSESRFDLMGKFRYDEGQFKDTRSEEVWKPAMEKARQRPLLGRGFGSSSFFGFTDDEYHDNSSKDMPWRTTVHSQFLEIFYEFGLVGSIVYLGFLVALLGQAAWILAKVDRPGAWRWRLLAIYSLLGFLEGFTHGGQFTTGNQNIFCRWLIYGCVLGAAGVLGARTVREKRPGKSHAGATTAPVEGDLGTTPVPEALTRRIPRWTSQRPTGS
ncbi:MAG: O-antigen ligase family protein [Verrucomicrobia bacterium]|nr:O-antigen ligase family protein [Verrucomicrobiota bacterium]